MTSIMRTVRWLGWLNLLHLPVTAKRVVMIPGDQPEKGNGIAT